MTLTNIIGVWLRDIEFAYGYELKMFFCQDISELILQVFKAGFVNSFT